MRGRVLDIDYKTGYITISGNDEKRYKMPIDNWPIKSKMNLRETHVDFIPVEDQATDVRIIYRHAAKSTKSRGVYIVLGLFFGFLGVHDWYVGRYLMFGVHMFLFSAAFLTAGLTLILSTFIIILELIINTTDGKGQRLS